MFGVCDVAAASSGAQQDRNYIGQPLGKIPSVFTHLFLSLFLSSVLSLTLYVSLTLTLSLSLSLGSARKQSSLFLFPFFTLFLNLLPTTVFRYPRSRDEGEIYITPMHRGLAHDGPCDLVYTHIHYIAPYIYIIPP